MVCGCVAPRSPGTAPPHSDAFDRAQAAIARGDWGDAIVRLGAFVHQEPSHPLALHARYLLGMYYLRTNDYDAAEEEFRYVAAHTPSMHLVRRARIGVADAARAGREFSRAAERYSQLLVDGGRNGDTAELMYKLGLARQQEGRWAEADQLFDRLRQSYGQSPFAARAAEQRAVPHFFSLQIAAYGDRDTAEKKRAQIERKGHAAIVVQAKRGSTPIYCVRVGSFATRGKALDGKTQMRDDPDFRTALVVP